MVKEIHPPLTEQRANIMKALVEENMPFEADDDSLTIRYTKTEPQYSSALAQINSLVSRLASKGEITPALVHYLRADDSLEGTREFLCFFLPSR